MPFQSRHAVFDDVDFVAVGAADFGSDGFDGELEEIQNLSLMLLYLLYFLFQFFKLVINLLESLINLLESSINVLESLINMLELEFMLAHPLHENLDVELGGRCVGVLGRHVVSLLSRIGLRKVRRADQKNKLAFFLYLQR